MRVAKSGIGELWLAARRLRRAPLYALSVAGIVGLGVGAAATVGSFVNALLLRPVAGLAAPDRLINIHRLEGDNPQAGDFQSFSHQGYSELARAADAAGVTDGVVAFLGTGVSYRPARDGAARIKAAQLVSDNYFEVLGVAPALGRVFESNGGAAADADSVVVGHGFWRRELGGKADILGTVLHLNGRPYTVVGVAPEGFHGTFLGFPFELWVPLQAAAQIAPGVDLSDPSDDVLEITARLAPGLTTAAAHAALAGVGRALLSEGAPEAWPRPGRLEGIAYTGLEDSLAAAVRAFLAILSGAALALLAVVAINAAGLVAARGAQRVPELAVRAALGASRGGLVRHLLVETVLLFSAGGAAGLGLAVGATWLLGRFSPPGPIPLRLDAAPDWTVAAAALALALLAGVAAGLAPALFASRASLTSAVGGTRGVAGGAGSRWRRGLVVAQVALTLTLLVAAGLFLRTLTRVGGADVGFDPGGLWMTELPVQLLDEDDAARARRLTAVVEAAARVAGVGAVTLADSLPLGFGRPETTVRVGESMLGPDGEAEGTEVGWNRVAPGYFETLRLPLVSGRSFEHRDGADAPDVVIVNQTFARRLLGAGDDPAAVIGRRFLHGQRQVEIVGVARDGKYHRPWEEPQPHLYRPLAQQPAGRPELVMRLEAGAAAEHAADAVLAALRSAQPDLPVERPYPITRHLALSTLPQRIAAAVAGTLGTLGLALSGLGLYALLAFTVARRGRELAVRQALGASPGGVIALVLREGLALAGVGAALGLVLAAGGARALSGFLHGIGTFDAAAFTAAVVAMLAVALLAVLAPARRAGRIQPAAALREQ